MQQIGLTRSSILLPIASFLERIGAPVEGLMTRAGLPAWALTDPEALIPTSVVARVLTEAARREGIDNIGLLSGQEAHIESLGVYGGLVRRSRTLGEALKELVRNHRAFSSNGEMWLVPRGGDVLLCQAFRTKFEKTDLGWQQVSHYTLMLMLGVIRLGAGATWRPTEVYLQTGESSALRGAEPLSVGHISFAQPATAISVPRVLFDAPLPPWVSPRHIPGESVEVWRASAPDPDFVRSVAQVVDMLSWEAYPEIRLTADVLGTGVRTLQRHLAEAGVTHDSLVGRARFANAAALLEETDSKILDIALDLGYSDHAHFTRAFRRWAGCSPQAYRRRYSEGRE